MRRLIKRVLLSNVVSFSQSLFNSFKSRVIGNSGVVEADSCAVTTLSNLDSRNLLQSATFVLSPSGYKSGVIYSQVPINGNGDLTVTRATTATRVNSSGLIESVASGVPQLDYSLGGCPNFLFEPQRTNVVLWSSDLSQSVWSKTNYTLSIATAIQGLTATRITKNSTNNGLYAGSGSRNVINTVGAFASGTKAFSVLLRKGNTAKVGLLINGILVGASVAVSCEFDFATETFTNISSGLTTTFEKPTTDVYRLILVCNDIGVGTSKQLWIAPIDSSNNTFTDGYVDVAYSQWEAGTYPTTYIPTTSAAVTRNATSFTRSNIYTNGLISASGFTWLFEIKNNLSIKGDQTDNTKFYGMFIGNSSTAPTSAICIYNDNTAALLKLGTISGTVTTPRYTTAAASIKVAITYDGTTLNAWVNGTKQISSLSFSATLSAFEHLAAINTDVPKYIAQMALWNTILPDSQCASLTS